MRKNKYASSAMFTIQDFVNAKREIGRTFAPRKFDVLVLSESQYAAVRRESVSEDQDPNCIFDLFTQTISGVPYEVVYDHLVEMKVTALAYNGKCVAWWDTDNQEIAIREKIRNPKEFKNTFGSEFRDMTGEHWNPFDFLTDYDAWFEYGVSKHFYHLGHMDCLRGAILRSNKETVYVGDGEWMRSPIALHWA